MKIAYIALITVLLALPIVRALWPEIATFGFAILITLGLLFDLTDFTMRLTAYLRRNKVSSAAMFVGLILMVIGVNGLTVFSYPIVSMFEWVRWKKFFAFSGLALILHLFIHLGLPMLVMMICNAYYKRRLFDPAPLPKAD